MPDSSDHTIRIGDLVIDSGTISWENTQTYEIPKSYVTSDRIGITGVGGKLATALFSLDSSLFYLPGDIRDEKFDTRGCDTIINCAARTDAVAAESDPASFFQSNVEGPFNLASICKRERIRLIHISTDGVFSYGKAPFKETDETSPIGVYAVTKRIGKKAIETVFSQRYGNNYTIIRTSFIKDWHNDKAFVDKFFSGDDITTIGIEILKVAKIPHTPHLIHIGTGRKSIYDVARKINKRVGKISLNDLPQNAAGIPYTRDTTLDTTEWENIKLKYQNFLTSGR